MFVEKELNELMDELFEAYGGGELLDDEAEGEDPPSQDGSREPSPPPVTEPTNKKPTPRTPLARCL